MKARHFCVTHNSIYDDMCHMEMFYLLDCGKLMKFITVRLLILLIVHLCRSYSKTDIYA